MSMGRIISWIAVALTAYMPVSWIFDAFAHPNKYANFWGLAILSALSFIFSGALAFFLVKSSKGLKMLKARETQALNDLVHWTLTPVRPTQALLQKGETAFASTSAVLKEIQTVSYSGGGRGMSVHVAKGVTLRSSRYRSHAVKGMVEVAAGELVVTSQRVIFAGDNKSFSIPLNRMVNVTPYVDGVGLHEANKSYLLGCEDSFGCKALILTLHKVLNEERREALAN